MLSSDLDDVVLYAEKSIAGGRYRPEFDRVDARRRTVLESYCTGEEGVELV